MYRIDHKIAEGGMGIVYRATEVAINHPVVVKAIRPEFAEREDFRARILDEGKVVAGIAHQNVVQMRSVFELDKNIYLVLEFVEGESLDITLARNLKNRQYLPVDAALSIFDQILQGVGAAHEEGVIHRDLKPANIMIQKKNSRAKVTDFGIAKARDSQRAATKMTMGIIGSPHYVSPEQIKAIADIDARTDVYSLGIVLYEMLALKVPFDANAQFDIMALHLQMPIPSIRAIRPDVPVHVENVICKACAKNRDQRFASTSEMAAALKGMPIQNNWSGPGVGGDTVPLDDKPVDSLPVPLPFPPIPTGGQRIDNQWTGNQQTGPQLAGAHQTGTQLAGPHQTGGQQPFGLQGVTPPSYPGQPPSHAPGGPFVPHPPAIPRQPIVHTPDFVGPNGLPPAGLTAGPLTFPNPPPKTTTPRKDLKKLNVIVLASAAALVLIATIVGIATRSGSESSGKAEDVACPPTYTPCGKTCCNDKSSECVGGNCVCRTGTTCDDGKVCNPLHACVDGCMIDGKFFAHGAPNPNNACQMCAKTNTLAWAPSPAGTPCTTGGSACDGIGACVYTPSIAAGDHFTCGVTKDGTVKCWGTNDKGQTDQFGDSHSSPQLVRGLTSIQRVAVGANHACALSTSDTIACWGSDEYGQIDRFRKVGAKETNQDYVAVAAGGMHTCAINRAGRVKCWGRNHKGQLGNNSVQNSSFPQEVSNLSGVVAISTGYTHTCAVKSNGAALCWGDNEHGRLGVGDENNRSVPVQVRGLESDVVAISAQNGFTCAVKKSGQLLCWGDNSEGQLGINHKQKSIVPASVRTGVSAVAIGDEHACAISDKGTALCWGLAKFGRLGNGNGTGSVLIPGTVVATGTNFTQISAGASHTCAMTSSGRAKCWGSNGSGELGIGNKESKSMPTDLSSFP
ncbi:MAG: protein kinase [Polyangiaceae bacterium]|nr:protein kinase [Polyangiaceae bacterium]